MQLLAHGGRQVGVRRLAQQRVPEADPAALDAQQRPVRDRQGGGARGIAEQPLHLGAVERTARDRAAARQVEGVGRQVDEAGADECAQSARGHGVAAGDRPGSLDEQQRAPVGGGHHLVHLLRGQRGDLPDEVGAVGRSERGQDELDGQQPLGPQCCLEALQPGPARQRARGEDDQQRLGRHPAQHVGGQVERGVVGEVHVVEQQHQRPGATAPAQQPHDPLVEPGPFEVRRAPFAGPHRHRRT